MSSYELKILNSLIDKYERSKTFIEKNKVNQNFTCNVATLFPKYDDDSEFALFKEINDAINNLVDKKYISTVKRTNGTYKSVCLNIEKINEIYIYLNRKPKKDIQSSLKEMLVSYLGNSEILDNFCNAQIRRIDNNKKVQFFEGSLDDYDDILKVLSFIENVEKETYQRDFSVKILGDSKKFETIKTKIVSILYEYGDFADKNTILEDLNIISNPGHVYFKGNGQIQLGDQVLDISKFNGDFALSTSLINDVKEIKVFGDSIITIENLTTFNDFNNKDFFVIYLGGYHNKIRRDFIKKIYEFNSNKNFYHFGDIDAGGFYILKHLINKTGIKFMPFNMDIDTLIKYKKYCKKLTDNDRKRLNNLLDSEFHDVVEYMLENDCKLEQEAEKI